MVGQRLRFLTYVVSSRNLWLCWLRPPARPLACWLAPGHQHSHQPVRWLAPWPARWPASPLALRRPLPAKHECPPLPQPPARRPASPLALCHVSEGDKDLCLTTLENTQIFSWPTTELINT